MTPIRTPASKNEMFLAPLIDLNSATSARAPRTAGNCNVLISTNYFYTTYSSSDGETDGLAELLITDEEQSHSYTPENSVHS